MPKSTVSEVPDSGETMALPSLKLTTFQRVPVSGPGTGAGVAVGAGSVTLMVTWRNCVVPDYHPSRKGQRANAYAVTGLLTAGPAGDWLSQA